MGSPDVHECMQNAEKSFSFHFFRVIPHRWHSLLNYIIQVTCDETWLPFVNTETKEQSKQQTHTHSPNKPKKVLNKCLPARKMITVFWNRKAVLMVKFNATSDHNNIRSVLWNTNCRAIPNKRCGMLTSGVLTLHDNAHLHTATCAQALLEHFK